MANIIANGTTELASADFTLTGSPTTLSLSSATGPIPLGALALVQIKAGSVYNTVGQLSTLVPAQNLTAVGTFRVLRQVAPAAFGVERD